MFFHFCQPILNVFWFTLLNNRKYFISTIAFWQHKHWPFKQPCLICCKLHPYTSNSHKSQESCHWIKNYCCCWCLVLSYLHHIHKIINIIINALCHSGRSILSHFQFSWTLLMFQFTVCRQTMIKILFFLRELFYIW